MWWFVAAQVVALAGVFQLNHFRAQVCEAHGAMGTGDDAAEIDNPNSRQRALRFWCVRHTCNPLFCSVVFSAMWMWLNRAGF